MNSKRIITLLIAVIVILVVIIMYSSTRKDAMKYGSVTPSPTVVPSGNDQTSTHNGTTSIPEEYVKLTDSTADVAKFAFAISINENDIKSTTVKHCVINVSAAAEQSGAKPECRDTSKDNHFALSYDAKKQTLTITSTDSSEWGKGSGPFRIGCAACESAVSFTGLRTPDGTVLPDKMVLVY